MLFTCSSLAEPVPPSPNVRRSEDVIVELLVVHLSTSSASASSSDVLRPDRGMPTARHVELKV